jgi:hypothetical protein
METVMSRIGRLLGMRMHNPTRPVCPVPQSTEAVPSNTDTAPVEQPVISKKKKKSRKNNILLKPNYMKLSDSIDTVKKLRSEGLTYRLIGEHLKLSKQRVYQIIQAGRQRDLDRSKWTFGLSVRNAKLMDRLEFKCKEDARKAVLSGGIAPLKWANFGRKSYNDLCQWLDVKPLESLPDRKCPHCGLTT